VIKLISFPSKFRDLVRFPLDILDIFKSYFATLRHYPLIQKLVPKSEKQFKNRYYEMSYYIDHDPAVYGSLKFIALTVSDAYKPLGHEIQKEVRDIVFNLMAFGDVIVSNKGTMLPLFELSIVDDKKRIGNFNPDPVITDAKYYILNEMEGNKRKVYTDNDVIHLSLFPQGHMIKDIYERWTYGIYGRAPMLSLLKLLAWKDKLIDDDIMIKDRMIPREVHKLKIDIPRTLLANRQANKQSHQELLDIYDQYVKSLLDQYRSAISQTEPGEHYVITEDVEIDILEPKINYSTPNDLLDQLTQYIIGVFNVPLSAVLGISKSSYAAELAVASYYTVQANALVGLVNEYLKVRYPNLEERLDSVNVVLDIWKDSIYKRVVLLTQAGVITRNEAREMIGLEPIEGLDDLIIIEQIDGRKIAAIGREGTVKQEPGTPLATEKRDEKDEYNRLETNRIQRLLKKGGGQNETNKTGETNETNETNGNGSISKR